MTIGAATGGAMIVAGAGFLATGNGLVNPASSALVSRISSPDQQGLNLGIVQSASALARIIGPAMAGLLFDHVAPGAPMFVGASVALLVLFVAAPRIPTIAR
jgi:MFS family permease